MPSADVTKRKLIVINTSIQGRHQRHFRESSLAPLRKDEVPQDRFSGKAKNQEPELTEDMARVWYREAAFGGAT